MTTRTSISRLADCAPIPRPESWAGRYAPGITPANQPPPYRIIRHDYIDDTPVMNAAHAALEAEARATARAVIKYRARAYALQPRELDAIAAQLSGASPRNLVIYLELATTVLRATKQPRWFGTGGEVPAVNLRGAMLYARYLRAKARQVAGRAP